MKWRRGVHTCIPPFSNLAWLADLGAIVDEYVSSPLNSMFNAVSAVARDRICSSLRSLSSVGINGNNRLLFLCNTRVRLRRLLASGNRITKRWKALIEGSNQLMLVLCTMQWRTAFDGNKINFDITKWNLCPYHSRKDAGSDARWT